MDHVCHGQRLKVIYKKAQESGCGGRVKSEFVTELHTEGLVD